MKRRGILNDALAGAIARLGHTDLVVVGDCGLPRPLGVPVVDLAVTFGVPTFAQVVDLLADELVVEQATMASETREANQAALRLVTEHFGDPRWVRHEDLKALSGTARLFVRTGEATPYANVVLRCGVPF
ncbi:D-ribose pyranase [Georgenia yuyongxinii]|uniref:D-ribose pyranase n=1 Tax=Georgenia yuyongxinii TaxID=2589797 RepID=A0A552WPD3_9MICO|nr:D-ribose pyranase [Georgenia yuyongxinii]TRW44615.1 D-ribose pyranase [Georgenia yuyongxinii]